MTQENYVPFSERYGYVHRAIQIESIDLALKNGLWNVFIKHVWRPMVDITMSSRINPLDDFLHDLWDKHFNETTDHLSDIERYDRSTYDHVLLEIKRRVFEDYWYRFYDFCEFITNNFIRGKLRDDFIKLSNSVLEREKSAYRFVSGQIVPITNDIEIEAIESAAMVGGPVVIQLQSALEKLSDRQAPDYRNSIKESISAVESQARRNLRDEKATLGQLLIEMERNLGLPKPIKEAFSTLYGYASGPSGVRHGPTVAEGMEVSFDLAKFMLVACSAFVNFAATLEKPHGTDS